MRPEDKGQDEKFTYGAIKYLYNSSRRSKNLLSKATVLAAKQEVDNGWAAETIHHQFQGQGFDADEVIGQTLYI
jgi:hypothetical protein